MIIIALILVPIQVNTLTDLLGMQSRYRTRYYKKETERHVIVTGHLTNVSIIRNFLTEFFHPDRFFIDKNKLGILLKIFLLIIIFVGFMKVISP